MMKIRLMSPGRAPMLASTAISSFFSRMSMLRELSTLLEMITTIKPSRKNMITFSVVIILYRVSFSW